MTHARADVGSVTSAAEVEPVLATGGFKLMTVTHVDTSTAVLAPVKELAAVARKHGVLVVVDGVCSVGGEALEMDAWGIDVAFTASQKALGCPPGLAVLLASPKALATWKARTRPVAAMYLDFAEWLPIHEAYEAERPSYFATPPVNSIMALDVSLGHLVEEGMGARIERHAKLANSVRAAWQALGLRPLPMSPAVSANTLSALYYPPGVDAALVKAVAAEGVVIAGGLHPALKPKYFRVGHMGAVSRADLVTTVSAIERALRACGHPVEAGRGVAALG